MLELIHVDAIRRARRLVLVWYKRKIACADKYQSCFAEK